MIAQQATASMEADVLIIGSGAGGATTATVLAEAGFAPADIQALEKSKAVG